MKREVKTLLSKSTDSILVAIEHFNRPFDVGRQETVLIMLDRGFELFLKASILHKGGAIRNKDEKNTLGFDRCLRKCVSEAELKCFSEQEALQIQMINSLRDAAQHFYMEISEQQFYIHTQAGITLYARKLNEIFKTKLSDYLPERVLPVSTLPPDDFGGLFTHEFKEIVELLKPKSRKKSNAIAKLRAFAIVESSLEGETTQPSEVELKNIAKRIQKKEDWKFIFPNIKTLSLNPSGNGFEISLKLTKGEGEAIHLVDEGNPNAKTIAIRKVNELAFYSLGLKSLAEKLSLTQPKLLAVIEHLKIQENPDFFKLIQVRSQKHKSYSPKALDYLKKKLPELDIKEIWNNRKK